MLALEEQRQKVQPALPLQLQVIKGQEVSVETERPMHPKVQKLLPKTASSLIYRLLPTKALEVETKPLRCGVLFSGGQAAGGHNVIGGLLDALLSLHPGSKLFGFFMGPKGLLDGAYKELTMKELAPYRNMGGFDLLGSGRDKIETEEQFAKAKQQVELLELDGLVIIGGDDSNTNAAYLAEYFAKEGVPCTVAGVPKTIDGDLKNEFVEVSFGFATAAATYANLLGNLAKDLLSARKQFAFVKVMGRSASHLALECALAVCPNYTLIGEEVLQKGQTLEEICSEMADVVEERCKEGKPFGLFLIPEGVIEFIPEVKALLQELNALLAKESAESVLEKLSETSRQLFSFLPATFQEQLLLDRDPHGNVQVSKIETERLLIQLVQETLQRRNSPYKPSFQPYFFGYEGRSAYPNLFDATYCYSLGYAAALVVQHRLQGYMGTVASLSSSIDAWGIRFIPLSLMMGFEERKGVEKGVITKALVDTEGPLFKEFVQKREAWKWNDVYQFVGPVQFFGPNTVTYQVPRLAEEVRLG